MGLKDIIFGGIRSIMIERPARKQGLEKLGTSLENDGTQLTQRFASAADNEANRKKLIHIIGMERWGQSRMEVPLGKTFTRDEHDGYCPPADASWSALQTAFKDTRQSTVALARQLEQAGVKPTQTVLHNDFGQMSPHGWLRYLNFHANQEAKSIK